MTDSEFTKEILRSTFPPKVASEFDYSGKCSYCKVEINFTDTSTVKILKNPYGKLMLYHSGCYERYIRRTID